MTTSRRRKSDVRRRVPQPVDLVVDRRVLLDVEVLRRDVRLGLVVVVVADEVLDGVLGQELAELVAELRREGLVVGDHQGRLLDPLDDVGHGERLARAGDAEQRLVAVAARDACGQRGDRLGLVAGEVVLGLDGELGHAESLPQRTCVRTAPRRRGARRLPRRRQRVRRRCATTTVRRSPSQRGVQVYSVRRSASPAPQDRGRRRRRSRRPRRRGSRARRRPSRR